MTTEEELQEWRDSAEEAARETCGDEKHCTCVGLLRQRLKLCLGKNDYFLTENESTDHTRGKS